MGGGARLGMAVGFLLLALPQTAWTRAGDLDPTFGIGGTVVTAISAEDDILRDLVRQPDGKLVAAGSTTANGQVQFAVVRYLGNGTLDPSFGDGGMVALSFASASAAGHAVALQADGKVIVVGEIFFSADFVLARFHSDGGLDEGFGDGGTVRTRMQFYEKASAVLVQDDGKIVVVGGSGGQFNMARYEEDGSLDASFGDGGRVRTTVAHGSGSVSSVAVQPDGRLILAGGTSPGDGNNVNLVRYHPDGQLDLAFGDEGIVHTPVAAFGHGGLFVWATAADVLVQPDGKIVIAGTLCGSWCSFIVGRYDQDGNLDPTFAGDGTALGTYYETEFANAVVQEPNGNLVVAGSAPGETINDFGLLRYLSDGTQDPDFGVDGLVTTNLGPGIDSAAALVRLPDGRVVAGGSTSNGESWDFGLVRYLGDPACGNGILEPPEDCDDGNAADDDCCLSDCTLAASGDPCADDGTICTVDICDGAGHCQHTPGNVDLVCRSAMGPCDLAERCDGETTTCPADQTTSIKTGCHQAERSILVLRDGEGDRDTLTWKWLRGDAVLLNEFGSPATTTNFHLCLHGGLDAQLLSGGAVVLAADDTAWRAVGDRGWRYRAPRADGIRNARLHAGEARQARVHVTGKGLTLPVPTLPIWPTDLPLRLQLVNPETGACWESSFAAPDVRTNDGRRFKARTIAK